MTGANAGIKLMYQSIRDEQEMEALKRQNLQAEMDYLKYQINPHFFMNTLNNIHALIDIDAEYAKNAVIELSKMMRYVLYDSGRERIPLEKDIQFLENYIELMRIRYTGAIDIRVRYPEPLPGGVTIPPLLLIVFVERLQARRELQPALVHPHGHRICGPSAHEHLRQQPPCDAPQIRRRHRARQCPQTARTHLRPARLHAPHRRPRPGRLHRQTRNTHVQCLNV